MGVPWDFQSSNLGSSKNWPVIRASIREPLLSPARNISRTWEVSLISTSPYVILVYLCKHLSETFGCRIVAPLAQESFHLVPDLGLVKVPRILLLRILPCSWVWCSRNLVDGRRLLEDLVGEALGGWEDLGVVRADEVLHELLQLLAVHLQKSLRDWNSDRHLRQTDDIRRLWLVWGSSAPCRRSLSGRPREQLRAGTRRCRGSRKCRSQMSLCTWEESLVEMMSGPVSLDQLVRWFFSWCGLVMVWGRRALRSNLHSYIFLHLPTSGLILKTRLLSSKRNASSVFIRHESATSRPVRVSAIWGLCALLCCPGKLYKNQIGKQILASEQNGHQSFLHGVYCELDQSHSLQRDR